MSTFVTIAAFTSPLEAHIARGRLEAENIQSFIMDELQIWNQWYLSNALGGIKLKVFHKDAEKAREIMQSHIAGDFQSALEIETGVPGQNSCPQCRSTCYSSRFPLVLLVLLVLTLGLCGLIFPVRKDIHTCANCKTTWKY